MKTKKVNNVLVVKDAQNVFRFYQTLTAAKKAAGILRNIHGKKVSEPFYCEKPDKCRKNRDMYGIAIWL